MTSSSPNRCESLAETIIKLPTDDDWLVYMMSLQRSFGSCFADFDSTDIKYRMQKTQYYMACIANEIEEIRDWLPWKEHKQYSDDFVINHTEVQFEIIDILCYLLNMAMLWGMDPELLMTRYIQKNKENIDRQKRGY